MGRRLVTVRSAFPALIASMIFLAACGTEDEPTSDPNPAPPSANEPVGGQGEETTALPNEPAPQAPVVRAPAAEIPSDCRPWANYDHLCEQRTGKPRGYLCSATYRAAGNMPAGCSDPHFIATSICCP
jgi:hypothetical protein